MYSTLLQSAPLSGMMQQSSVDWGVILIQLVVAVLMGLWAKSIFDKKGRSPGWGFVIGFFLGIIGVIICAVVPESGAKKAEKASTIQAGEMKCPHCLEIIKIGATVCKHCGQDPSQVAG